MKPYSKLLRLGGIGLAACLGVLASAALVHGFAEEHVQFRDPAGPTGAIAATAPEVSTIHDDLTFVLALAAGFSITDANTLRIWDELVDAEILTGTQVYSNGAGGVFYPSPVVTAVCPALDGPKRRIVAWPDSITGTFTSRFGPYSPFFHFPHRTGPRAPQEMGALHDWGWGLAPVLTGYEAYAWGGLTVMQAECYYTRTVAITTTVPAGSLPAFATYIHSLADSYSHQDCLAQLDALGKPWGTHTISYTPETSACYYLPWNYSASDVHGREFFTYTEAYSHTDPAIRAVYAELVARSLQREGSAVPLSLDAVVSGTQTLSETLSTFVHTWDYNHGAERRAYLDSLALEIANVSRAAIRRVYLPLARR